MPAIDPNTIIDANPVYAALDKREYTGTSGDYLNVNHSTALATNAATVSLSFSLDRLVGDYALVSKDGSGRKAGDFSVYAENGALVIVQESATETEYLRVPDVILSAQTTYQLAVSFGPDGLMVRKPNVQSFIRFGVFHRRAERKLLSERGCSSRRELTLKLIASGVRHRSIQMTRLSASKLSDRAGCRSQHG